MARKKKQKLFNHSKTIIQNKTERCSETKQTPKITRYNEDAIAKSLQKTEDREAELKKLEQNPKQNPNEIIQHHANLGLEYFKMTAYDKQYYEKAGLHLIRAHQRIEQLKDKKPPKEEQEKLKNTLKAAVESFDKSWRKKLAKSTSVFHGVLTKRW